MSTNFFYLVEFKNKLFFDVSEDFLFENINDKNYKLIKKIDISNISISKKDLLFFISDILLEGVQKNEKDYFLYSFKFEKNKLENYIIKIKNTINFFLKISENSLFNKIINKIDNLEETLNKISVKNSNKNDFLEELKNDFIIFLNKEIEITNLNNDILSSKDIKDAFLKKHKEEIKTENVSLMLNKIINDWIKEKNLISHVTKETFYKKKIYCIRFKKDEK